MIKIKMLYCIIYLLLLLATGSSANAQAPAATALAQYSNAYLGEVTEKLSRFNEATGRSMQRFLNWFDKQRDKLYAVTDSAAAKILPAANPASLQEQAAKIYLPYLDTLNNSLAFLQSINAQQQKVLDGKLARALQQSGIAQSQLSRIKAISTMLEQQQNALLNLPQQYQQTLQRYLGNISKEWQACLQQVANYKTLLTSPGKAQEALLAVIREIPAFQKLMAQNSLLAGLFQVPGNYGAQVGNLQTRSQVLQLLQERTRFAGLDATALLNNQLEQARGQLNTLKSKAADNNEAEGFRDFESKTTNRISVLQRIELSAGIRFSKQNNILPSRSEMLLQVGYKFSPKASLGVGFTYWLGLGKDIRHIALSNEGIGFSSYFKMQLRRRFFASGGWEQNYFNRFARLDETDLFRPWRGSALIGVGKQTSLGKSPLGGRWGKQRKTSGTITLLYDLLHRQQQPHTEAFKLRVGYGF
jgi:hypothetical protein